MKPDWKDAPEWAQWLAINDCGEWWWFEFEPHVGNASWRSTCGRFRRCDMLRNPWRETIEQRPE